MYRTIINSARRSTSRNSRRSSGILTRNLRAVRWFHYVTKVPPRFANHTAGHDDPALALQHAYDVWAECNVKLRRPIIMPLYHPIVPFLVRPLVHPIVPFLANCSSSLRIVMRATSGT